MQQVAQETVVAYERRLEQAKVPPLQRPQYHKWTRFYLDFCHKYAHPPRFPNRLAPFLAKLAAKNQSLDQRQQAAAAVTLLLRPPSKPTPAPTPPKTRAALSPPLLPPPSPGRDRSPSRPSPPLARPAPPPPSTPPPAHSIPPCHPATSLAGAPPFAGHGASWQNEYRDLEASIKMRNYSRKTFAAYRFWVARFQAFVRSRPTAELGADEVRGFLSELAVRFAAAASTQIPVVEG